MCKCTSITQSLHTSIRIRGYTCTHKLKQINPENLWSINKSIHLQWCGNGDVDWGWTYYCRLTFPSSIRISLTVDDKSHVTAVRLTTNLIGPSRVNGGKSLFQFLGQGVLHSFTERGGNVGIRQIYHKSPSCSVLFHWKRTLLSISYSL